MRPHQITILISSFSILCTVWWYSTRRAVNPDSLLKRSDLTGTSVTYAWTGGFGDGDVHATFLGSGSAELQVGPHPLVRTNITVQRYRELMHSLASNNFNQIRVRRRWGTYLHDIGRYEVVLTDGARKTMVYADEKHYIAQPERISPIIQQIYSFQKEFGQRLDYGPFAMAASRDAFDLIILAALAGAALISLVLLLRLRRRRKTTPAEPAAAPNAGSAGAPPAPVS